MLLHNHPSEESVLIRRILIAFGLIGLALAIWQLLDIVLLIFGSILIAVLLRSMASVIAARTPLDSRWSLVVAVVMLLVLIGSAIGYLGPLLIEQLGGLADRLSAEGSRLAERFRLGTISDVVKEASAVSTLGPWIGRLLSWGALTVGAFAALILVISGGIYIAADPELYRRGFLSLVPPSAQANVSATLDDVGLALRRWLVGQLGAMVLVGGLSWLGFMLIGLPSAAALGLIAGIAEFVPIIGPVAAAIPALLIAASMDWQTVLYTLAIAVLVQQLENNLIMPLIIERSVAIPPAVGLFSIVALGVLLGPLGLLLGFPLAVVIDAAVRRLYIRETLGEPVDTVRDKVDAEERATQQHDV